MTLDYQTTVFPIEELNIRVNPKDLLAFKSIGLNRINNGSHLIQLKQGPRTIGLSSLKIYPQYEEVYTIFIEICSDVRGNKHSRKLLCAMFDYAANMSKKLRKAHLCDHRRFHRKR